MAWAVELYLDEKSAEKVRRVSSPRLAVGAHPHISLAVSTDIAQSFREALRQWAKTIAPLSVVLDHWGLFVSDNVVLFLAPRDRAELNAVHRDFYQSISHEMGQLWEHYTPDRWIPHCTVDDRVALDACYHQVAKLKGLMLPITATLDRVALIEIQTESPKVDQVIRLYHA